MAKRKVGAEPSQEGMLKRVVLFEAGDNPALGVAAVSIMPYSWGTRQPASMRLAAPLRQTGQGNKEDVGLGRDGRARYQGRTKSTVNV